MLQTILNKFRKKDKRNIPVIHVHTFKTGEKLYTYSQEHYGHIASRYWYALNRALNYLTMYGADEQTVRKYFEAEITNNKKALEYLYQCKSSFSLSLLDSAIDIILTNISLAEFQKTYIYDKTALQLKYQEILFCMFYLLDEEIEGGYTDALNERKLKLINSDIETRDIFFSSVQNIAKDLDIILETNTAELITQTVKLMEIQSQSIQKTL